MPEPLEPDNIVLQYLRRLEEKVDRLAADVAEMKTRIGRVETTLANMQVHIAPPSLTG